jgi:hypothetical protein
MERDLAALASAVGAPTRPSGGQISMTAPTTTMRSRGSRK